MLSPPVEVQAFRALGGAGRRALETVGREVGPLGKHQQWRDDRSAQRRKEGLGGVALEASCREDRCPFQQTGRLVDPAGEKGLWSWETFCRNECWRLLFPQSRAAKRSKN